MKIASFQNSIRTSLPFFGSTFFKAINGFCSLSQAAGKEAHLAMESAASSQQEELQAKAQRRSRAHAAAEELAAEEFQVLQKEDC